MFPEHNRTRFCDYNDHDDAQRHMNDVILPVKKDSLLIADNYPACTLMFADIVVYTKWTSKHQPKETMLLLETVYGAFDNILPGSIMFSR
jgi:class 3 adenylate cyclase